jgi:hypothetical protein
LRHLSSGAVLTPFRIRGEKKLLYGRHGRRRSRNCPGMRMCEDGEEQHPGYQNASRAHEKYGKALAH